MPTLQISYSEVDLCLHTSFRVPDGRYIDPGTRELSLIDGGAEDSAIIQIKCFPDTTEDLIDTGDSVSPLDPVYLLEVSTQRSAAPMIWLCTKAFF
jgi:hypothetical protein